ncbi:hypothetical protein [Nitrosomonas sp. Nm58]|uniref:hypothetical protein n=1 Tax=Nitrosomonas sp. Nm58 TaxID=200126 RepID=UPI00089477CD|nr:hypothetical protein [Nitrosomonas sp. Nm58]SDY37754.1 hypothetical protein SAMN05421754_100817 [Nitrosomonas sp. Nm58]
MTLNLKIYTALMISILPISYFIGKGIDEHQIKQEQERIHLSTPIGLGTSLPASFLELYKNMPCGIESIVVEIPHACGGKEFNRQSGDYRHNCYWQVGNDMHVEDWFGEHRVIPISKLHNIFPEKDQKETTGALLFKWVISALLG